MTPEQKSFLVQLEYYRLYEPDIYQRLLSVEHDVESAGLAGGWGSKLLKSVKTAVIKPVGSIAASVAKITKDVVTLNPRGALSHLGNVVKQATVLGKTAIALTPAVIVAKAVVPKSAQRRAAAFEKAHRKEIKIAGALAAVAIGAYLIAPEAVGGAMSSLGTSIGNGVGALETAAKTAGATLAKNLGVDSASKFSAQSVIDAAFAKIPDAAHAGAMLGDKMTDYVAKIGKDKFQSIVTKYSGGAPVTSTDDPRLAAMTAELNQAANGTNAGVTLTTNPNPNPSGSLLPYAVPVIALATFFLK